MSGALFFYIIVVIIFSDFVIERILEYLNIKHMSSILPEKLKGIYDEEKYDKFQR